MNEFEKVSVAILLQTWASVGSVLKRGLRREVEGQSEGCSI